MNSKHWNSIKKHPDKAKKMLSALHMSPAYMKVSWNDLDEGEQAKISKWIARNGSGWFERGEPTPTPAGIKNVAPKHRKAAIKKESAKVMRTPMEKAKPVRTVKEEKPQTPKEEKPEFAVPEKNIYEPKPEQEEWKKKQFRFTRTTYATYLKAYPYAMSYFLNSIVHIPLNADPQSLTDE